MALRYVVVTQKIFFYQTKGAIFVTTEKKRIKTVQYKSRFKGFMKAPIMWHKDDEKKRCSVAV